MLKSVLKAPVLASLVVAILLARDVSGQDPVVKLEVIMGPDVAAADAHEWLRALGGAGADDVKIRGAKPTDLIEIRNLGNAERPVFVIYAELRATGRLHVPGRSYTESQMPAFAAWIDELRKTGIEGAVEEKLAFGLTPRQLLALHEDLSAVVDFETKGQPIRAVLDELADQIGTPVSLAGSARRALQRDEDVNEELQGLSVGTVLAAVVRPFGLVAQVVRDTRGQPEIRIVDSRSAEEFWPVGWPLEESPDAVAPELSEKIKVEITDFKLSEALQAIESKIGIRFLIDQNSLAAAGIELDQVRVSYAHPDAPYRSILRRLLAQARPGMKYDLRTDENQVPFLWITTRATR